MQLPKGAQQQERGDDPTLDAVLFFFLNFRIFHFRTASTVAGEEIGTA